MAAKSIKRRLHLGLAISLTVAMAVLGTTLGVLLTELAEEFVIARLEHDGESLLEALQVSKDDGRISVPPGRIGAIYRRAFSGHYWVVVGPEGQHLQSRSLWDEGLSVPALAQGASHHGYQPGPLEQDLLVWSRGFHKQGVGLTIAVAEDISPLVASYHHLLWVFISLSLGVLLVLLWVQGRLVTLGFRPLAQTRRELERVQHGELQALSGDVPNEVRPLVAEVNHLLSLFSERLQRSRHAVGNLAHALKGPLGVLHGLAGRCTPEVAVELEQQSGQIQRLLERELKRARLAGNGVPGQRFDPAQELPVLVALLEKVHAARELRFDCQAQAGIGYAFDRDDMLELVGNLLDNAGKWADEQVRCRFEGGDGRLQVTVEDDGPGCPDDELQDLTGRGVRIDEGRPGHGLGLAIVQDIVGQYRGRLEFGHSPDLGGLRVVVELEAKA